MKLLDRHQERFREKTELYVFAWVRFDNLGAHTNIDSMTLKDFTSGLTKPNELRVIKPAPKVSVANSKSQLKKDIEDFPWAEPYIDKNRLIARCAAYAIAFDTQMSIWCVVDVSTDE